MAMSAGWAQLLIQRNNFYSSDSAKNFEPFIADPDSGFQFSTKARNGRTEFTQPLARHSRECGNLLFIGLNKAFSQHQNLICCFNIRPVFASLYSDYLCIGNLKLFYQLLHRLALVDHLFQQHNFCYCQLCCS